MRISNRFEKHVVAAASVAMGAAAAANAAVVYSGVINFACAVDINGTYINVQTNTLNNDDTLVPGWDVNPYSSAGGMNFFNSTGGGQMRYPGVTTGPAGNLALGTSIGATGDFNTFTTGVVFGSAAGNWQYSAQNVIGFRFVASAGTTHYGWMRFQMGAAGSSGTSMTRTVVDYGYESTAATAILAGAGAVPAPGAIALLGLAGFASRRRRN
jgi:MYXO-CTERM domain-containing protein